MGAFEGDDHEGGQVGGLGRTHSGVGELPGELADPVGESLGRDREQAALVGDGRAAVDGDRRDRAAAALGGRLHRRADVAEERLHDLARCAVRQFAQVTADVRRVLAGRFECELLFAAGEVVIDRPARGPAPGQDFGEGHRGQTVLLQQPDRRADHAGPGVHGHRYPLD